MRRFLLPLLMVAPAYADPVTDLGERLFSDVNLSINGTQSCASCHDPAAGFAATGPAIMLGAAGRPGGRKPPTAAYAFASPVFHHVIEEGAPLFLGGLFHDGRATGAETGTPLADQAGGPLLNPDEMALPNAACAVQRACETSDLASLDPQSCAVVQTLSPCDASTRPVAEFDPMPAYTLMRKALAAYEASAAVSPFSSRFDAYQAGQANLTQDEVAGLALFQGKAKCSACHVIEGDRPLFTDFTYDNLGLPGLPGAAPDPGLATTLAADPVYASLAQSMSGKFKVPTLRNVAAGQGRHYMHNGYFETLAGVMRFYNTRDVWPVCPTLLQEAEALQAKCWPAAEIPATVNHDELGNLGLTTQQEAQIVAFLASLTDQPD